MYDVCLDVFIIPFPINDTILFSLAVSGVSFMAFLYVLYIGQRIKLVFFYFERKNVYEKTME